MKKIFWTLLVLGILAFGYVMLFGLGGKSSNEGTSPDTESPTDGETAGVRVEALYACAEDKRFMAALQGDGGKLSFVDGRFVALRRLPRVDEAEGDTAGYESADGTTRFFISSGFATSAYVLENGVETYRECTALAEGSAALETALNRGASGAEVTIVPLEVLEDSRCPVDVVCIQAGTVRLRARLSSGLGETEQIFELGQPITTEAEEVTLATVLPAPHTSVPIDPQSYRFYFSVVKRSIGE